MQNDDTPFIQQAMHELGLTDEFLDLHTELMGFVLRRAAQIKGRSLKLFLGNNAVSVRPENDAD